RGGVARLATAGRRAHRRASARLRLGQRVPRAARWTGRAAVPDPALPVGPRRGRGGAVGRGPPRAGAPSAARPQNGGRVSSLTPRRLPIVLTIVALLAGGGLADRGGRPAPAGAREQSPFAMPVAAPSSALSSTWYCAGGTSQPKGFADGWLVLANAEDRTVHVDVTFIPNDPSIRPRHVPVDVKPLSQLTLHDFDYLQAQFVAATVEVRGGGVVAEHFVLGPGGASVAQCASSASDRWYFADGGTTRDATELLALFNPFPEDAIVDLSFTTEAGGIEPEALQALVVP